MTRQRFRWLSNCLPFLLISVAFGMVAFGLTLHHLR
jgi:hypothetical protein